MIIILAGDAKLGIELGSALGNHLAQTAVLQPEFFAPIGDHNALGKPENQEASEAPWLAGAMAVGAQRIARHGGTCVVVLPRLESVSSLLVAFDQLNTPLFLYLLRKPAKHQGIFRRAEVVSADGRGVDALAIEVSNRIVAGRGLLRPAPSETSSSSLLPTEGGPSTGVDIIEIPRIARIVERYGERFLGRVYTEAEQALYRGRVPELAARFAAKEAVSKALGTGIWGIRWREMEILPDMRGKPLVYLHGAAAARARELNLRHFAISLSHSREFAMAVVTAS
jgi:holo-[acyl-carrier protein] synthase